MADPEEKVRPGVRGSTIRIEARLDGRLMARIGEEYVELSVCVPAERVMAQSRKRPARKHVPPPGTSRWMDGFSVRKRETEKLPGAAMQASGGERGDSLRQQGV